MGARRKKDIMTSTEAKNKFGKLLDLVRTHLLARSKVKRSSLSG
jgi:hypothetical protein